MLPPGEAKSDQPFVFGTPFFKEGEELVVVVSRLRRLETGTSSVLKGSSKTPGRSGMGSHAFDGRDIDFSVEGLLSEVTKSNGLSETTGRSGIAQSLGVDVMGAALIFRVCTEGMAINVVAE